MKKLVKLSLMLALCISFTSKAEWPVLHAPWRKAYDNKFFAPKADKNLPTCVFCRDYQLDEDERTLIIRRFKHSFVALNMFPYKQGHLLILPNEHVKDVGSMSPQAQAELMWLIGVSSDLLKKIFNAPAINVGINMGVAAGATKEHLHVHVLPRWNNDTNFIHVVGQTSVLTADINEIYQEVKEAFAKF